MTEKEFIKRVVNGKGDFLQTFIDLLKINRIKFCVIGGLGVNAYAEPVVSLDLDVVIVSQNLETLLPQLKKKYKVEKFPNSTNVNDPTSALRIQIQTGVRYQDFIKRAKLKNVLGYKLPVAAVEDILQGKIWAAMDETQRPSKRQKDLADILRLIEVNKKLAVLLPEKLRRGLRIH